MKNIIILQHEPLTPNIEKKFCLKELINAGFSLEYWDISQIIYPGLTVADEVSYDYLHVIRNFDELKTLWQILPEKCIIIPEFFFIPETASIWKLMRSKNYPLVKIERYANTNIGNTFIQKLFSHIKPSAAFRYVKNVLFRFYMSFWGISETNRYDYYLTSGVNSHCNQQINHPDYDDFLLHRNDNPLIEKRYICFIDTGFGIHPDQKYFIKNMHESNEVWQMKLSSFFSKLEDKYNMPVIIAVHPKITYPDDAFCGRKKIKYQTLNLVNNAEFVLQDISNSLAFSIIANKKIGLITTNEVWKEYKFYLTQMSKKIEIPIFNVDKQNFEEFEPSKLNESLRLNYMNEYLCSEGTKNKLTSEILIEFFRGL